MDDITEQYREAVRRSAREEISMVIQYQLAHCGEDGEQFRLAMRRLAQNLQRREPGTSVDVQGRYLLP